MNTVFMRTNLSSGDSYFDEVYPEPIKALSKRHWTPVETSLVAATFLASGPGKRIMDIGSGVGKFCLAGAALFDECHFYGIEQRADLVNIANDAKKVLGMSNVTFEHGNFFLFDFDSFDGFYFYNSFYENLAEDQDRIDNEIPFSEELYDAYSEHLFGILESRPSGTRLVTYHYCSEVVPPSYELMMDTGNDFLKCWIKY